MPDLLPFLGEVALRSSLVLATVFILLLVMKRASASERHVVLVLGLIVTALVPAGILLSPKITWTIAVPHQVESSVPTQNVRTYLVPESQNPFPQVSSPMVENKSSLLDLLTVTDGLILILTVGMLTQGVMLGRAVRTWRRIGRGAVKALLPVDVLEKARVFAGMETIPPIFASDQVAVPLLTGWLRPAIILPSEAARWPSQRLLMAVCHELAHFRRGDSLLLPLVCLLRVLYWWHPLVWLALARLRIEREKACDDLVLNQNFRASDYADLIVDAARHARAFGWQNRALAMASSSNVGERIRAILNPRLNRKQASRTTVFIGGILAFALGWFFVAAQVQAKDVPATSDSTDLTAASKPQIKLEFRFISINETTYHSHQEDIHSAFGGLASLLNTVNHLSGTSCLATPSVTTQDGMKAKVELLKAMSYATKFDKNKDGKIVPSELKTRDLGYSIEALPTLTADSRYVRVKFKCHLESFEKWKEIPSGGRLPIFNTFSIETEDLVGKEGIALLLNVYEPTRVYLPGNGDEPLTNPSAPKRILLVINARPVPAAAHAATIPSNAMVQVSLKYFQISEKTYAQQTDTVAHALAMTDALNRGDMSYFSRFPDFDLLTQPAVLMKVGEQGVLESVKKMSYPVMLVRDGTGKFIPYGAVTNRLVGMRFVLKPELLADGTISLSCFDEITNFKGWVEINSEEQPVFNTSRVNGKYALVTGKPFGTWVRTNFDDQSKSMSWKAGDPLSRLSQDTPKVRTAMIITAKLYSTDGSPMPPH